MIQEIYINNSTIWNEYELKYTQFSADDHEQNVLIFR